MFNLFRKTKNEIDSYKKFYKNNNSYNLTFYGLVPFEKKGTSTFHREPYLKTIDKDFLFDKETIWEYYEDENDIEDAIFKVRFGNIIIAKEGCGIYWLLITSGIKKGEIWLLTESGITPVCKNIEEWKQKLLNNKDFWYENLKNIGPFDYAFFYSHAPKKMITINNYVFGVTSDLCRDCDEYMKKVSIKYTDIIVITSPKGTVIYENGMVESV